MEFIAFFKAIVDFVTPRTIGLMAFSMSLGIIVGALPGLSAVLGIALLTGITYSFGKLTAMIMMMGVYIGAIYAGSLSAILINIPGTGSAAATCLDGYQRCYNYGPYRIIYRVTGRTNLFPHAHTADYTDRSQLHFGRIFLAGHFRRIDLWISCCAGFTH